MHQPRHVPEHPFDAHVARLVRRHHLAANVHAAGGAIVVVAHRHRGAAAVAEELIGGNVVAFFDVAAVGDQAGLSRRDRAAHQEGEAEDEQRRCTAAQQRAAAGVQRQHQERGQAGQQGQVFLRALRAEPRQKHHAERRRPDDGAKSVGGVGVANDAVGGIGIVTDGGQGQRKARPPQHRRRQHGDQTAQQVVLVAQQNVAEEFRVDAPEGDLAVDHEGGQRNRRHQADLAPGQAPSWSLHVATSV